MNISSLYVYHFAIVAKVVLTDMMRFLKQSFTWTYIYTLVNNNVSLIFSYISGKKKINFILQDQQVIEDHLGLCKIIHGV